MLQPLRAHKRLHRGSLTALLMGALTIPTIHLAHAVLPGLYPRLDVLFIPGALLLGVALGGAIALRLMRIAWPTLVAAALGAALLTLAYLTWQLPELAPGGVGTYPGAWLDVLKSVAILLVVASAGVLVLPLVDPVLRRQGPAPVVTHVVTVAVLVTGTALLVERYLMGTAGPFLGLATLTIVGIGAVVLAGLGLVLSLLRREYLGAWLGSLAVLLWLGAAAVWMLLGSPWFP